MMFLLQTCMARPARFLSSVMLAAVVSASTGCTERTSTGAVAPEGFEKGIAGVKAANKARRSGLRTLNVLWTQRRGRDITTSVLPFLRSPSTIVQKRAIVMLGRLASARALKPLRDLQGKSSPVDLMSSHEMVVHNLYPELPLAIGRIKARSSSGRAKLDVTLAELNLNFGGLASLSQRINGDRYGWERIGFGVIEDVVRVLAEQKRGGQNVDAAIAALTLRPEQKALLQAVSTSPSAEADRLLHYMARTRGEYPLLIEQVLDLPLPPKVVLDKVSVKLQDRKSYSDPFGIVGVVRELAFQKNARARVMLQTLAKEKGRPTTRAVAQSALNQFAYPS